MELSVIVCVYNTPRELLRGALLSVRRQRALPDAELIVVDDGSDIDYTELVAEAGGRLIKTENRGILSARLTGISEARGDYLAFLDSDDTLSYNFYRPMLDAAEREGADAVYNDWAFHTDRARFFCADDSTVSGNLSLSGDECLRAFARQGGREHAYYVLWNKIYRRELLSSAAALAARDVSASGLSRFNYGEDALISFYVHRDARRITGVHTGYYFYRIHSAQSVSVTDGARLRRQIECMRCVFAAMRRGVGEGDCRGEILQGIRAWEQMISRTHYSYAKRLGDADLYPLISEAYGVERLRTSRLGDGRYNRHRLLSASFTEADELLSELWEREGRILLSSRNLTPYRRRQIELMREAGVDVEISPRAKLALPPTGIPAIEKFVHSPPIYTLGALLFKKGSRVREYLKKKL